MYWAAACGGTCAADTLLFYGTFGTYFTADLTTTWECCMAGMDIGTTLELTVKLINYDTVNSLADYDTVTVTFNGGTAFTEPTSTPDLAVDPIASAAVLSAQTLTMKVPIKYSMVISDTSSAHSVEVTIVT